MAYEIHTIIDGDAAPSDSTSVFDNWYANHSFVLTDRESANKNEARADGTLQGYHEFRVFLSLQESIDQAISDLTDAYPDASWMVVNTRRNDAELTQSPLSEDETYHEPNMSDGLRASVDVGFDSHTVEHETIHYVGSGVKQSIPAGEYSFDKPEEPTTETLYADVDGLNTTGGVEVATAEVHPGRIADITAATQPTTEGAWTTTVNRGSPPSHFANETEALPTPEAREPVERQKISQETKDIIDNALANNNTQKALAELAHAVTGDNTFDPDSRDTTDTDSSGYLT